MELRQWSAAGGALLLNALIVAALATLGEPTALPPAPRPIEVALLRPPEPEPVRPEPPPPLSRPRPPEPMPVRQEPRRARPAPPPAAPQPAPAPTPPAPAPAPVQAAPAVVAKPSDEPRPNAIQAPAAPPSAPVAPRVTEGVAAAPAPTPAPAPTRVGPRLDASWAGNAPPPYPALARRLGEEGEVRLDVHVGADGTVLAVKLVKSSGSRMLDQTAIDTVKTWRFRPATVDGKPVDEWYRNWKWVFKLEG